VAIAQQRLRLLPAILVLIACAACEDSSSSLAGPSRGSLASGAIITGRVSGVALTATALNEITSTTAARGEPTRLRVTIQGTNISTMVDGAGQFTLIDVPPGTVTLTFTGNNITASITLDNVSVGDEIRVEVRLNSTGTSARIESESRRRDDNDKDKDDVSDVTGTVSALSGTCPALTFGVGTRVVKTGSATVFDDRCTDIRNGVRVEVRGARMGDGTFTATRVEVDD
jgi:hypothetical protein